MTTMKPDTYVACLLGDLVGSRRAADRRDLHDTLTRALADAAAATPGTGITPLHITAGDEFQGVFRSVGEALDVALRIRLQLLPDADVRCGVGWGPISILDEAHNTQDGPGWWAARTAIDYTKDQQQSRPTVHLATAVNLADGDATQEAAVNAALVCRDHLIGSLDERSLRILKGLMAGTTKAQLAADEGVSPSAVTQRTERAGLDAIATASQLLREL